MTSKSLESATEDNVSVSNDTKDGPIQKIENFLYPSFILLWRSILRGVTFVTSV